VNRRGHDIWSAVLLGSIRTAEVTPASSVRRAARRGSADRVREVFQHPIVRPIVLSHMVWSISAGSSSRCTRVLLRELRLSEGDVRA